MPAQLVPVPAPSGRVSALAKMGRLSAGIISNLVRSSEGDGAYKDNLSSSIRYCQY